MDWHPPELSTKKDIRVVSKWSNYSFNLTLKETYYSMLKKHNSFLIVTNSNHCILPLSETLF